MALSLHGPASGLSNIERTHNALGLKAEQ